jgi:hypothetical protein
VAVNQNDVQVWMEARKRHRLNHAQVQMARELGVNPKKLGKIDNHEQERWKAPLPQFIEHLYFNRFGKERPDSVLPIEDRYKQLKAKRAKVQRAAPVQATAGEEGKAD